MPEFFKVSSGLKTLIGSELITDKNVAVFELVKNSFDAGASEVIIRFENLKKGKAKIIIQDNGKGMNYEDLRDKWLFVAFSAKRDKTEDKPTVDYREKIKPTRFYAGAKGVGRFSCDRLGSKLNLITVKNTSNRKIENLFIDWGVFDLNQSVLFDKIPADHKTLESSPYKFKQGQGTVLEITGVYIDEWGREDLKKLKDKLSKLVRPGLNRSVNDRKFSIFLEVPEEKAKDQAILETIPKKEEWKRYLSTVNGEIKNFIFDLLDIKTTKIVSKISEDQDIIITELIDRDSEIYKITEHNSYANLKGIEITLYFMSTSAKATFTSRMGIENINYGNVFLYKNGFRIMPYGEPRDDSYGIDARGLQGIARYLGTRNLIGQVEINGEQSDLKETTSRDGGLVKTKSYYELKDFFFFVLKRLEKYVVDVANWGLEEDSLIDLDDKSYKEELVKLIANVSTDKSIINLEYNKDIVKLIGTQEEGSAKKIIRNFKRIGASSNNKNLLKDAAVLEKKWAGLVKAKESAEKEAEGATKSKKIAEEQLEEQIGETLFAKAVVGTETKELLSIQHHIYRHSSQHISHFVDSLIDAINNNASKEKLLNLVDKIAFENKKIATLSRFVTKARYDTTTSKINADLIQFVNEYVLNVYQSYKHLLMNNQNLRITCSTPKNLRFDWTFKPIELIIILDNLLNNSFKAGAKSVQIVWKEINNSSITLHVIDDGIGISDRKLEKIFEFRYSTTNGSGLGLYHAKQIIEALGGSISVNNKLAKGVEFILKFKK
jgi:signal transduction histidine kinase